MKTLKEYLTESDNGEEDVVTLNVPLLLRIMEWSREEVDNDKDLHIAIENMIALMDETDYLTMDEYEDIVDVSDDNEDDEEDDEEDEY